MDLTGAAFLRSLHVLNETSPFIQNSFINDSKCLLLSFYNISAFLHDRFVMNLSATSTFSQMKVNEYLFTSLLYAVEAVEGVMLKKIEYLLFLKSSCT